MREFFKSIDCTKASKKALRHSAKEWWDGEAQDLWDAMHQAELAYTKENQHDPSYKAKFRDFIAKQQRFDKVSQAKKRKTARNMVVNIEKANTEDPQAFWKFIQRLSPRNKKQIHGKPSMSMVKY